MRQSLVLMLVAAAVVAAGCASGKPEKAAAAQKPPEAAPAEAAKPAPVAVAEPVPAAAAAQAEPTAENTAPVDDVPGLPAYPGATRTKLDTSTVPTADWSRRVKVELDVRDTFENVKAFYAKVIKDNGWQVTGVREEAEKAGWKLSREGATAEVRVEKTGRKRVEVRLERKDR